MFTNKNSDTLRFSGILCQAIIKGGGCGQAHKYFPFMQSDDSQTAWLFVPKKLLYRKILWALPKPAIFEKIE